MRKVTGDPIACGETKGSQRHLAPAGRIAATSIAVLVVACGGSTAPSGGSPDGDDVGDKPPASKAGTLDTSFAPDGAGLDSNVYAVVDDDDDDDSDGDSGKKSSDLLIGGVFTEYSGTETPFIARLFD